MLNDVVSLCHRYHVPVVVDEAHGSHLHLLNRQDFQSAVASQADVVVQSTHKTLNSLSQTAMMHLPHRAFSYQSNLDAQHVQRLVHKTFSSLTTTSPNAILLASLDATRSHAATEGLSLAARSVAAVNDIKQAVRSHPQAAVLLEDSADVIRHGLLVDPLRLTIHYAAENNQAVDDCMCEDDGIYCELNEMGCIAYNIPVFATSNYLSPLRNAILKSLERIQQQNPMGKRYIFVLLCSSITITC
jgi:arginine/lysine/ornithine decarboxylase